MKVDIRAFDYSSKTNHTSTVDATGICPRCNTSFNGETVNASIVEVGRGSDSFLIATHFCAACKNFFIASYYWNRSVSREPSYCTNIWPARQSLPNIPPEIEKLSPQYKEIYNQAYRADQEGLHHVCGCAYRKALEFLVKDYAISRVPNDSEAIKAMSLGAVIQKYIENDRLKTLAEKSAWLGNDETHYLRKHEDRTLEDMKKFLQAMVSYITFELAADDAMTIKKK